MILRDENKSPLLEKQTRSIQDARRTQEKVSSKPFFHWQDWATPIIAFAQMLICISAWTFAGCMMHKTIPLPDSAATWIQNNPSDVNVIVTLVSTILALISSSLLGKAVQYALVHRLSHAPLRLHTVMECTKLAQRSISLSFHKRHLLWTLLSIGWVCLMSFLTTAWSSLLAPEPVVISYDLRGNEADFLNPSVSNLFSQRGAIPPGSQPTPGFSLTPETFPPADPFSSVDITASLTDAGFLATSATNPSNKKPTDFVDMFGSPYVSNISTGGIYPAVNLSAPPPLAFSEVGNLNPAYQGTSRTYRVTQHGFTASISCQTPTSSDPAITSSLINSVFIGASDSQTWAIDTYSWFANCSPNVEYSTVGVSVASGTFPGRRDPTQGENGLLMTSVCFGQSFAGLSNQSFLVLFDSPSDSSYSFFTPKICQITPLVTTVQANYDATGIINVAQPPLNQHPLPDPSGNNGTGVLMWLPALTLWTSFVRSQALTANLMGDRLLDPTFLNDDFNLVIENYLRGMMEYLGTFIAQSVSNVHNPRLTVPFNGTMHVSTVGWAFRPRIHGPSLAAITLVALLTLLAAVLTVMQIRRDNTLQTWRLPALARSSHDFDPTEIMDVLLASSGGDLARVLERDRRDGLGHERVQVVLGAAPNGRPVLRTVTTDAATDMERHTSLSSRDDVRSDECSSVGVVGSMELGDLGVAQGMRAR